MVKNLYLCLILAFTALCHKIDSCRLEAFQLIDEYKQLFAKYLQNIVLPFGLSQEKHETQKFHELKTLL